jgi:hypothetical protein
VGVQVIGRTARVLRGTAEQGRDVVLRCASECLSSWIMDRRKGQPCTTRKRKWHRALFSATRKRGKSDPLAPPHAHAIDCRQRRRASRDQPVEAFHLRVVVHPMRTAHHLKYLRPVRPPVHCQCRDAPGFGDPGTVAPACSPADNWWLVLNMRCVHVHESGQTG